MCSPWIVLDRDGVINIDSESYIKSAEEWQPIAGSIHAIARLKHAGFKVALATNQSGLRRGLFDLDDLEAMHAKMQSLLAEHDAQVDAIFYCPHLPEDNCQCRKPKTGLLDALEREFAANLQGSYFVGDHIKDLQVALKKNCQPILVLTGKGHETQKHIENDDSLRATPTFQTLNDFVNSLLEGSLS